MGTENIFAIPAAEAKTNSAPRVLVVDDDISTHRLTVTVLVDAGYDVESAQDGAAGWEMLQAKDYDLIITNNHMPRMTGIEMIAKIRSTRLAAAIIMTTEILPTNVFAHNPWLKPNAWLKRPFSKDELVGTVKKVLFQAGNRKQFFEGVRQSAERMNSQAGSLKRW